MRLAAQRGYLLLVVLSSIGLEGCRRGSGEVPQPALPKVTVGHPVLRKFVDEDEYTGWLAASATVEVRSRVRGHIKEVPFKDGDFVKTNDPLFELDPEPFQVQIDQGKAQAKALEAQKVAAEKDVARYSELIKSGGATQQQLEKAKADAAAYDAQIAAKLEEVKRSELDLKYSKITAPIDGVTSRALLTKGNLVNAGGGDPLLTTIVAVDPIYAYFTIDERAMQRYQKMNLDSPDAAKDKPLRDRKMPFRFALDSDQGFPREGVLDFADNKVDSTTGTIEIRGTVKNDPRLFVPGSRVRVRVAIGKPSEVLVVPDTAVLTDQTQKYLLVLGKDNVVLRRPVTLGKLLDDGARVVLPGSKEGEGLTPNDWLITLGLQRARENYPVEPLDSEGKPIEKVGG